LWSGHQQRLIKGNSTACNLHASTCISFMRYCYLCYYRLVTS
jgi:hypothetical protein